MNIGLALSWECWRRGFWVFLLTGLGATTFPSLVYGSFRLITFSGSATATTALLNVQTEEGCLMHCTFFAAAASLMAIMVVSSQGSLIRYLTLPVSIRSLVGWKMVQGFLAAVLMYGVMGVSLNLLFQLNWPLLGPALFVGTLSIAGLSIRWSLDGYPLFQILFGVPLIGGLFYWLAVRYGFDTPDSPLTAWTSASAVEIGTLLAASVAIYVSTVVAVSIQRGERTSLLANLIEHWGRRATDAPVESFPSPSAALAWEEWKRRGRPSVSVIAVLCSVVLCIAMTPRCNATHMDALVAGSFMFLMLLSGLLGVFLGQRTATHSIGTFAATQPISDGDFGRVILRNVVWCAGAAYLIWATMVAALVVWFVVAERSSINRVMPDRADLFVGSFGACYVVWCLMSIGAMLGVARRWCLIWLFTGAVIVSFFLMGQDLLYVIIGETIHLIALVLEWAVGIGLVVTTIGLFAIGCRWHLFGGKTITLGLSVFVFTASALFAVGASGGDLRVLWVLFPLSCLPAIPIAGVPVALAWNRHR